jgi:SH3 domain protein
VKNFLIRTLLLLSASPMLFAAHGSGYVTDQCEIAVRSGDNERSKIVKMLSAGTAVDLWSEANENGYTYVHTADDVRGFMLSNQISAQPSARSQLDAALKKLDALQEENRALKSGQANHAELGKERDKLSSELLELQQTSANAMQIKQQRDDLQEQFVNAKREIEQLKRENQALSDSSNQDWFLYGGCITLGGMILGFVLPRLSIRRRSSGWDTF